MDAAEIGFPVLSSTLKTQPSYLAARNKITPKLREIKELMSGEEDFAALGVRSQAISGNGKHDYSGTGEKISDQKVEEIGVCGPRAVA